jgi:hypothetical protein
MGGANLERTQRDAMTQQHLIEMRQQAAQRSAWRPEVDAVGVIVRARQRVLHGTTHD